jgi:phosphate transport system permease protein
LAAAVDSAAVASASVPRPPDRYRTFTALISWAAPALLILIVAVLFQQAWPSVVRFGPGFLIGQDWNQVTNTFGALPFIFGTVVTSAIALAIALPVGIAVAVLLAEPGAQGLRGALGTGIELLAAIPSVVYGIWALYVLAPWALLHIETPITDHLAAIPFLGGIPRQTSLFTAALVLAVMILPTLSAVSRDVIRAVPRGLRESTVALGATWWETIWQVILPAARAGIFGATVLALGRALAETVAVAMVIGNRPEIPHSIFSPGYTLAAVIANEFVEATGEIYQGALVEIGLVLILVTLTVNLLALLLVHSAKARAAV